MADDLHARLYEAIDTDPLLVIGIVEAALAERGREVERLRFEEKHLRSELAKADAENNAAGQRARRAEDTIERVRVVAEQLKRGSLVEQEIADRLIRTLDPKPDDPAVLADRLAACPLGLRHHGCDCEPLATDGRARTTTDNGGHCQGCADSLAACREEGGRCCDLCQHPASPKEQ